MTYGVCICLVISRVCASISITRKRPLRSHFITGKRKKKIDARVGFLALETEMAAEPYRNGPINGNTSEKKVTNSNLSGFFVEILQEFTHSLPVDDICRGCSCSGEAGARATRT